jgi:hypothetical protein
LTVDEIVAAYDKALGKLDDGFNAVKKKNNQQGQAQLLLIYLT